MTLEEWASAVQVELGTELDLDLRLVLDVARDAAHAVQRPAAPVTTFLMGYAAALRGGSASDVADVALVLTRMAAQAAGEQA
ncbi:MAG: DUF6457 domain-containing protein [Nocardioidaceae bacterium]